MKTHNWKRSTLKNAFKTRPKPANVTTSTWRIRVGRERKGESDRDGTNTKPEPNGLTNDKIGPHPQALHGPNVPTSAHVFPFRKIFYAYIKFNMLSIISRRKKETRQRMESQKHPTERKGKKVKRVNEEERDGHKWQGPQWIMDHLWKHRGRRRGVGMALHPPYPPPPPTSTKWWW